MNELNVPAAIQTQRAHDETSSTPLTLGKPIGTLDSVGEKLQMLQATS
jgi:hypothetical protein